MSTLIKFGGKGSDGTAKAIATNNNGNLEVAKKWTFLDTEVLNEAISDTSNHFCTPVDVSEFGLNSIRIINTTSKEINVRLLQDVSTSSNTYLVNCDGSEYTLTIPAEARYYVITPETWPVLNYLHYLRILVSASTAPSSGSVKVHVMSKR